MVYFGPSQACLTCKRRRKKCDETRPSCMRCLNAKRTCGGYEDGQDFIIRQYSLQNGAQLTFQSMARKCSLPARVYMPGTDRLQADGFPKEIREGELETRSIQAFLYGYCVIPLSRQDSRGYLAGLEPMLLRLGLDSDLANACRAVAFASGGITLRRPILTRKAEVLYHGLLGSLARAVVDPVLANTPELLMMAMLLGLYEMVMAQQESPSVYLAHARGVAAILQINSDCALQLLRSVRCGHPLVSNSSIQDIFSLPSSKSTSDSLDDLLLVLGHLCEKAESVLGSMTIATDELYILKEAMISLDRDFAQWQSTRAQDYKPTTVGEVSLQVGSDNYGACYWPGRVDTYPDLYVAGVWNTARVARLLLFDLIMRLSSSIPDDGEHHSREHEEAQCLVVDMLASIPYHLAANLQLFLQGAGRGATQVSNPGRPVGGLLLMNSLQVASQLAIVPPRMREYMRDCLDWIGSNMGIGQASLMARTATGGRTRLLASDSIIVWTGFLV